MRADTPHIMVAQLEKRIDELEKQVNELKSILIKLKIQQKELDNQR